MYDLKNDAFIQYIINVYFPCDTMSYHEKIQTVFSSIDEFTTAMDCFKLGKNIAVNYP
jgi:hypothetical protein